MLGRSRQEVHPKLEASLVYLASCRPGRVSECVGGDRGCVWRVWGSDDKPILKKYPKQTEQTRT